jgi:hypothetical protein
MIKTNLSGEISFWSVRIKKICAYSLTIQLPRLAVNIPRHYNFLGIQCISLYLHYKYKVCDLSLTHGVLHILHGIIAR